MFKFLQYPITAKFGAIDSIHKTAHTGVDIGVPVSTPAQSLTKGVVDRIINNDNIIGNAVCVKMENGKELIYGHLSQINATYMQHVKVGDVLGLTGGVPNTYGAGRSNGSHIHIGLLSSPVNGKFEDPTSIILGKTSDSGFLSNTWHVISTSGTDLLGEAKQSVFNKFLSFISDFFHWIIQNSDYALLIAMIFALLTIFGSKKAVKGIYWTFAFYLILQFIGVTLK